MIFVLDDDREMAECIARAAKTNVRIFGNAIEAINALNDDIPELIFLDILLDGPDGFTFLNELMSYSDTNKIPVVIVTSLELSSENLDSYGVVGVLNKDTMTPKEIRSYVEQYVKESE